LTILQNLQTGKSHPGCNERGICVQLHLDYSSDNRPEALNRQKRPLSIGGNNF
jgi:hypothetical protein